MVFKNLFKSEESRRREREENMKRFIRETERRERQAQKELEELKKLAIEAKQIDDASQFNLIKTRYRQRMGRLRLSQRMRLHVKMMLQDARMADGMKGFVASVRDFSLTMRDATKDVDMAEAARNFDAAMDTVEETSDVLEETMDRFDQRITEQAPESLSDDAFDRFIADELEYEQRRTGGGDRASEVERELREG